MSTSETFRHRAYASMMLFGEYAFHYQKGYAIACAIDQSVTINLTLRDDDMIFIDSVFGQEQLSLSNWQESNKFRSWLVPLFSCCPEYLKHGMTIKVLSTIDSFVGIGSSTALIVALLKALAQSAGVSSEERILEKLFLISQNISHNLEIASFLSSFYGCTIAYGLHDGDLVKYRCSMDLVAIYTGSRGSYLLGKERIDALMNHKPIEISKILQSMQNITSQAMSALSRENLHRLGELMTESYILQKKLAMSSELMDSLIELIDSSHEFLGGKISGPGQGDCVLGLGNGFLLLPQDQDGVRLFHIKTVSI